MYEFLHFKPFEHREMIAFNRAEFMKRWFLTVGLCRRKVEEHFWWWHKSTKKPLIKGGGGAEWGSLFGRLEMWCIVWCISLLPTLCRCEQTLHLLLVESPQQYSYLSCKAAIQIDEVQQHDIFCTSITLLGLATWVKSQQTITFPDISSPHSNHWWILPDKAFIIAQNRECTKISSLFFPPFIP